MNVAIGSVDLLVLGCYVVATVAVGMWVGRGQKDMASYLLGDRDLPWWAILGSIVATETSTATFLSVPGLAYAKDGNLCFLQLAAGYIVGRLLIVRFLLPLYFEGQLFTAYEVLDRRFGPVIKRAASIVFLVPRNLGDGLRLFLTAIVLQEVAGLPLPICIALMGASTIAYTLFGGMRSVVWNDCIQFVIYIAGGVAAAAVIVWAKLPGGWEQFTAFVAQSDRLRSLDFDFSLMKPFTFWAGMIGGVFLTMGTHGTDQLMVQRYLSARSRREASLALALSGVVVFVQFAFFLFIGLLLSCYFAEVRPQTFEKTDRAFAVFIVRDLPQNVGLVGLVLAAVLAAAMSTLSSSLNSSAASAVNDLYLPLARTRPTPGNLLMLSRVMTAVFGGIQIALGIGAMFVSGAVVNNALAIAGFSAGLLLGLYLLGVFTAVRQSAALAGLAAGLCVLLGVKFGTALAWPWFAVVGSMTTLVVGIVSDQLIKAETAT